MMLVHHDDAEREWSGLARRRRSVMLSDASWPKRSSRGWVVNQHEERLEAISPLSHRGTDFGITSADTLTFVFQIDISKSFACIRVRLADAFSHGAPNFGSTLTVRSNMMMKNMHQDDQFSVAGRRASGGRAGAGGGCQKPSGTVSIDSPNAISPHSGR